MDVFAFIVLAIAGAGLLMWLRGRRPSTPPSANKIISDFGAFVERCDPSPLRIEDVSVLPHSKDAILSALLNAVVPGEDKRNDFLMSGANFLAQFQAGVGREPLYQGGFDLTSYLKSGADGSDLAALQAEAQAMVAKAEKSKEQAKRFEMFHKIVEQDLNLMMSRFRAAAKKS